MTITLDLDPVTRQGLLSQAQQRGMSLEVYLRELLSNQAQVTIAPRRPLKTGRGLLAKYGPAPSAEEIDENRRDMFRGFAQDF